MPLMDVLSAVTQQAGPPVGAKTPAAMLFACWAIVIVLALMIVVFLRAQKKEFAVAILPLMVAPFVHIFSGVLSKTLDAVLPLNTAQIRIIIDLLAGLISCLLLGLLSRGIPGKRTRNGFFWCCAGFVVILTLVLITNTLTAMSAVL